MLTKGPLLSSTSLLAQGGIAAAVGEDDDPALHAEDTLRTGRGLCRPSAVSVLTDEAPARIRDLVELGVEFDEGLGLEGGHSRRRVVHAGGAATGDRVARKLAERVLAHPRITVAEGERMLSVWRDDERCVGVVTDRRAVAARATLLSTGGAAALWERTTNPAGAVGEGIAAAYRAGAALADLEFVQFHPTTLVDSSLLLSEALRGEGAVLLDDQGNRFTDELAPRDVVAREIAARGTVLLDLRAIDRGRFPSLMGSLVEEGYDPSQTPIPVAPAAHYTVGGVLTDLDGRSEVPGLYAAGECAATGVHGANRLASNSLLECLVFGRRAALAALGRARRPVPSPRRPGRADPGARDSGAACVALARLRSHPRRRGSRASARSAPPADAPRRPECAHAGGEPRLPLPRGLPVGEPGVRTPRRPSLGWRGGARGVAVATDTLERIVHAALAEDIGAGDVTTEATVAADAVGTAGLLVKEAGVVCGLRAAEATFRALDPEIRFEAFASDGDIVEPPAVVARVAGSERAILTGERVALNFLGRLSGIATLTRSYVDAIDGTGVAVLDTRKTTPGLRALEKHAVASGGGRNHRFGLDDAILIKDNHLRAAGSIAAAVELVRAASDLPIEVECDTLEQVGEALDAGVDAILLDNMPLDELRAAVELTAGRARLEASGGVTLDTIRAIAETGVDEISVGALTHSARSLDVSLELT